MINAVVTHQGGVLGYDFIPLHLCFALALLCFSFVVFSFAFALSGA